MSRFTLLASDDGGVTYSPLAMANLSSSYLTNYGYWGLLVSAEFPEVTAQDFRLEVVRFNTTGPRIVEFDGIAAAPEPGTLALLWIALPLTGVVMRRRGAGK